MAKSKVVSATAFATGAHLKDKSLEQRHREAMEAAIAEVAKQTQAVADSDLSEEEKQAKIAELNSTENLRNAQRKAKESLKVVP